jgi:hypothetical protein
MKNTIAYILKRPEWGWNKASGPSVEIDEMDCTSRDRVQVCTE